MRALVTGGAGFIGSNLVDALLDQGAEVVVIDDLSTGRRANLDSALERGAELVVADLTDPAATSGLAADRGVQCVFHLAAQIDVRRAVAQPAFDARINVEGTITALEAAREAGVKRFVFVSTGGAIYGEGQGQSLPLTEDAPCLPMAPYGQSKYAAEGYVDLYRRQHGLSAATLRLANVYGPRQDPLGEAGVVAIFCGRLAQGLPPVVYGDGRQTRDYVFVHDVVEALLAAGRSTALGTYNIGTGLETSVLELIDVLGSQGRTAVPAPAFEPARAGEVQRIAVSPARAAEEINWRAKTDLQSGIAQTLASLS
jgi:UDP-glucose 4-epimerase